MSNKIRLLDYTITNGHLDQSSRDLMKHVRPQWKQEDIKVTMFTEGITNKLVGCYVNGPDDMVLVRVYGDKTDLIIDRMKEKQNMMILNEAGLCPELHCSFNNGICYGYVDGVTLDEVTVRRPDIQRLVAKELVTMHSIPLSAIQAVRGDNENGNPEPCLTRRLKRYINIIPTLSDGFDDPVKQKQLENEVPSKEVLEKELSHLLRHLAQIKPSIVFSHNDLLCKNIVYSKENDQVTFIDYEYGDYNYQIYDIGNHFCEYAGVDDVDFTLYPDKTTQLNFLRHYLTFWYKLHSPSKTVTDDDLERLYSQANKYALAAHFWWGLWALIQAKHSSIDFDYLSYGVMRLNEYFARRDEFFALPIINE